MFAIWRQTVPLLFLLLVAAGTTLPVHAADVEGRAFAAAEKKFNDGFHQLAEKDFATFIAKYPQSTRLAQAVLLQARAAAAQRKFEPALALLATNMTNAAALADQFQFWTARTFFDSSNLVAAANAYAALVARFTNSPLRTEALLGEVQSRFRLKEWPRVVELLQAPGGVFQGAAARTPTADFVVQGRMLLAEALLEQQKFAEAEQAAAAVPEAALTNEAKWRREFLRAQAQLAAQRLEPALATSSNLVGIAVAARLADLEAAGLLFQGQVLEALRRPADAIATYEQAQRAGLPAGTARHALFKSVGLMIEQENLTNALGRLQAFLAERPQEAGSDVALLTMAELRLKQHELATRTNGVANGGGNGNTNLLTLALADADKLVREWTNSAFLGKAQFVRGWTLFAQGNFLASLAAFRAAAELLPWSEDQAVARFKAGDLEFQTGDVTNALRNYRRVVSDYASLPRVQEELVPRARYQILQASLVTRDLAAANESMEAVLREYPRNGFTERTLLLYGHAVDELGEPRLARNVFSNFVARFPGSPLRPDAELAIARSYEREGRWTNAIVRYDVWVNAFPTNRQLPEAEFARAMAHFRAGQETNALTLFTNFVVRFPTNTLAARAQNWIAGFYFRAEQFDAAERNYQIIFENPAWKLPRLSELRYYAELNAGRAAMKRLNFSDARYHFTNIIDSRECPDSVRVLAYFEYGNAFLEQADRTSTNALERFSRALSIYSQVPQFHPAHPLVPRAWGAMANCHFQLGVADPENYARALDLYGRLTNAATADASSRAQALVGIGNVLREQAELAVRGNRAEEAAALRQSALQNYLAVLYASEEPDATWIKEAAFNAAAITEAENKWERALNVYQRLTEMLPALKNNPALVRRIDTARERAAMR